MAGPSGRPERLLAELGERRFTQLLLEALHLLGLPASYLSFNPANSPHARQSSVCVPRLQLWPGRRVMLHCRERHRLAELNISFSVLALIFT